MTNPTLAEEFPWLQRDAAEILGDSRPRSIRELLGKKRLWLDLYRDWLTSHNSGYLPGLEYMTGSKGNQDEYNARFRRAYPQFYEAAGQLKDAVRRTRDGNATVRFPWAPPDARPLLGHARPSDFDALMELDPTNHWVQVFKVWLEQNPPFEHAASWLDWLLEQGRSGESWVQALDPTVEAFAEEIGRLKKRMSETHGTSGQRFAQRVQDAGERVGLLDPDLRPGGSAAGRGGGGQQRPGGGGAARPGQPATNRPGGGAAGGGAAAGGAAAGGAAGRPGSPGARTTPGGAAGRAAPVGAAGVAGAAGRGAPSRAAQSTAVPHAEALDHAATPLVAKATELSRWVAWLSTRFAVVGGHLAQEAANLQGYQQLIDRDGAALADQLRQLRRGLAGSTTGAIHAKIAGVRNAVFTLAWNVDLGYTSYYGGWPHHSIGLAAQALNNAGSPQLCVEAGQILRRLAGDVESIYTMASGLLDIALQVITTPIPEYTGEDSAEAWGTHEVMGAQAELSGITQLVNGWPQEVEDDEDQADLNHAAQAAFGVPYQNLSGVVGYFA
jgi:hypothetical protein